jgi:hypothetical protein
VPLNPAAIGVDRARLFRPPLPRQDQPALGFIEVAAAQLGDRERVPVGGASGGGITAPCDFGESVAREVARLIGGQDAIAPERQATASTVAVPILEYERLGPGGLHAETICRQFVVPHEHVAARLGMRRVYGPLCEFRHGRPGG